MEAFIQWLEQCWVYIAGLAGIIATLRTLIKNIKEIKEKVESPIADLNCKVDNLSTKLDEHIKESEIRDMKQIRSRILRFADEIVDGQEFTKAHYESVLSSIDEYERYCNSHPNFPNNQCLLSIQRIKDEYLDKCDNNSFVSIERLVQVKKDK